MSRGGLRLAFYCASRGIEACRAPQWLTQPWIFIGPPRSGWWPWLRAGSRILIGWWACGGPTRGRRGDTWCGGWLGGLCGRGGWLRRNCWPGLRPLKTPREVSSGRQGWFRCRHRDGEAISRDFGWLNMVNVYRPPYHVILIYYLISVRDPLYKEGALPPWCQLTGTLGRSSHHEDETTFVIRVNSHSSWRWGHLLVGESEALLHNVQWCHQRPNFGGAEALIVWQMGYNHRCR